MIARCCLLACILFSLAVLCTSQECMSACDAGLTVCNGLDYQIYVDNNANISFQETYAKKIIAQASVSSVGPVCSSFIKTMMCNLMHPSCNGSDPTPIRACGKMCYDYVNACGGLSSFLPNELLLYLDCAGTHGNHLYSNTTTEVCSYSKSITATNNPCPYKETTLQYGGACQAYNPTSLNLSSAAICAPFVDKQIWVPADWPRFQVLLDYLFIAGEYLLRFEKGKAVMPLECYKHMGALICGSYFPTCVTVDVAQYQTTAQVAQKPCQSFCEEAVDKCWDYFKLVNLTGLITNCTTAYPETKPYSVTVGDTYAPSTCRNEIFTPNPVMTFTPPVIEKCPVAFGIKTEFSGNESPCGLSCPDSSYTTEEWHRLVKVTRAGSSLSLFFMLFLIVSYMVQFEKRKFPSVIHFWEFVATAGFAISFLVNGKNPEKDVWCKDPGTSATQSNNAACGAQGFLFIFFGLSLAAWCLVIAFIIFYGVVQNKKVNNLAKFTRMFHLFCWGGPLVFAVAALASKSIGYGPPLAWCFIHFEGFGYGGAGVSKDYPLFYIPMLILFVVILILFIATVSKIVYIRRMNVSSAQGLNSRTFQAQIRVLIFILVVFVICVSIFEWRFEIESAKSQEKVGLAWAYCKMQIALALLVDPMSCPGEINPARIDYSRTVGECFVLSGIGILIFVGFGADLGIYKHWYKIIKLTSARQWDQLNDLVIHDKDPFKESYGSRTKSTSPNASKNSRTLQTESDSGVSNDEVSLNSLDLEASSRKPEVFTL